MNLETLISPDPAPNILNLSLLICHLFVGGNFRTLHILYHPDAFDDHMLRGIDSACPSDILKTTVDISLPESNTTHRPHQNQQSDYILQLIFLPEHGVSELMDQMKTRLSFYRVFVFSSSQGSDANQQMKKYAETIENTNSSSLLVIHNKRNGTTDAHIFSKDSNNFMKRVDLQKHHSYTETEMFELTLGDKALGRSLGVAHEEFSPSCKLSTDVAVQNLRMIGRLYFTRLNMSFLDREYVICGNEKYNRMVSTVRPIVRSTYNELSLEYDESAKIELKHESEYTTVLQFGSKLQYKRNYHSINSYKWTKIHMIFVYGADFNNQFNPLDLFHLWKNRGFWVVLVVIFVSTAILYFIRRLAAERMADFSMAFLEVFSVVIGGGSIQYQHRWERIFFAFGLGATFFLMSIYMADFSMSSVLLHGNQRIDTVGKLAKLNVPFFYALNLASHKFDLMEMLSDTLKRPVEPFFSNIRTAASTNQSFVYIVPDDDIELYEHLLIDSGLDYDMIKGVLGSFNTNFRLEGRLHVPQQTIEKFNQLTSALMENGWFGFVEEFKGFISDVRNRAETVRYQLSFDLITLQEFYQTLVMYFCCLGVTWIILLVEIIWYYIQFKLRQWERQTRNLFHNVKTIVLR